MIGGLGVQPHFKLIEKPFWTERLPKLSNGEIQAQIKGWDELGLKGPEAWHFVQEGTYQVGDISMARNTGDVPINAAIDLAGLTPTPEDLKKVIEAFRPTFERWYEEKYQIKVLAFWPYPPQLVLCREPMKELADLKARKVRVSSKSQGEFVESFGAAAVYMASPEVQTALQNRVIDCGVTSALSAYKQGWQEGAKYLYPLAVNWQVFAMMFNLKTWKSLSPKLQALIAEQAKVFEKESWDHNLKEADEGVACMTGKGVCPYGKPATMALVEVKEADRRALSEALRKTIVPNWAKQCGAECATAWNATVGKVVGVQAPIN